MFAAINHNPTHFFICTIEVTDYSNMVSSRELLFVQTSISPKCQQLIVCYTCQIAEHSSNITYKCSVRMSTKEGENVPPTLSNDMHHQQYTIEAIDLSLQRIQDRQRQQQQEQKPLMSPERFCSPQWWMHSCYIWIICSNFVYWWAMVSVLDIHWMHCILPQNGGYIL